MFQIKLTIVILAALTMTVIVFSNPDQDELSQYLVPSDRIDSDNPSIIEKMKDLLKGTTNETEKVKILFEFVRDMKQIEGISCGNAPTASNVLKCRINGCYGRSVLLAALCRSAGIPARLHLQKVILKNNLPSGDASKDIVFAHLLTGIFIDGSWKLYESVGNNEKWAQWMGVKNTGFDATVQFRADRDCLFQSNDRIIIETLPVFFTGFDQSLIEEIKKIDGGIYL